MPPGEITERQMYHSSTRSTDLVLVLVLFNVVAVMIIFIFPCSNSKACQVPTTTVAK